MRLKLLPLVVLPLLACSTSAPLEDAVTSTSPIQGGQPDPGHPAIGQLGSGCTATLVAPNMVLTAAHCTVVADRFTVSVGGVERVHDVVARRVYPGFTLKSPCPSLARDLAVVRIDPPITDVSELGEHTTIVSPGDGIADHGDSGGPLLFDDRIIGSASCETARYPDPTRRVHYERVDQPEALAFIRAAIVEL